MKFHKYYLLFIFIFYRIISFGQNNSDASSEFYNSGMRMYLQDHFKEADSLFELSLKKVPQSDTYYYLALSKLQLSDTCGYCSNLLNADGYGKDEAGKVYEKNCFKKRTINYNNNIQSDSVFMLFLKT